MKKQAKKNGSKPAISELGFTILTILKIGEDTDKEYTGYNICKLFSDWAIRKVTHQQVYKNLRDLDTQGIVEHVKKPTEGKPDRKCYKVTDYGKRVYADILLLEQPKTKIFRSQYASMYLAGNRQYFDTLLSLLDDELALIDLALEDDSNKDLGEFAKMNMRSNRLFKQAERDSAHMYLMSINQRNKAIGKIRAA